MARAGADQCGASFPIVLLLLIAGCGGAEQVTTHPAAADAGGPDTEEEIAVSATEPPPREPTTHQVPLDWLALPQRVFFEHGSTELSGDSKDILAEVASALHQFPQITKVQVIGYRTAKERVVGAERNLSLERARAVRDFLVSRAVAQDRLVVVAGGIPEREDGCPEPACSRRAEFAIDYGPGGRDEHGGEETKQHPRPKTPRGSPCLSAWNPPDLPISLQRAKDLYLYGSYREAIVCFSRIVELDPQPDDQVLALAYQYLGASYYLLEREAEARSAFERLLVLAPDWKLDPLLFPQPLVEFFYTTSLGGEIRYCGRTYQPDAKKVFCNTQTVRDLSPVAALKNLRKAELGYVEDSDLTPLAELTSLRELSITAPNARDLAPLAGLTNLRKLALYNTQTRDLSQLAGLTNLRELDLGTIQSSDLSWVAGLRTLRVLMFRSSIVSDLTPLAGLPNLRTLYVSATEVTDISPFAGLNDLRTLSLSTTRVSDLSPLSGLQKLRELHLDNTQVSDLSSLASVKSLVRLDIRFTRVEDYSPLFGLKRLQELHINLMETDPQLADLEKRMPGVKIIPQLMIDCH